MATVQEVFVVGTQTITINPEGLSSSATFVLGRQSAAISNVSTLDLDHLISGTWTSGISPLANTQVQVWVVPVQTDNLAGTLTWPSVFTASNANRTVTSYGILQGCARLGAVLNMDLTTDNITYSCGSFSVAALFGGKMPTNYVIFITHNTNVPAGDGPFDWQYQRIKAMVS